MFKNFLKPDVSSTDAEHRPTTTAAEDELQGDPVAAAISDDELQAWRGRIVEAKADDAALLRLAHEAPAVELKLAALESLTQEDSFKQAMREFGSQDKRLYRAAKSRWQEVVGKRKAVSEANALIASARALLEQDIVPVNRVVDLDRAWAAIDVALVDPALTNEFSGLSAQLGSRVRATGEKEQAITRWLSAADAATGQLRAALPGVARGEVPPMETETLARGFLELLSTAPDANDRRCTETTDAANRALAIASSVVQRAEFVQLLPVPGLADEATEKSKIEQWRDFPEVPDAELQAVLASRFADWRNATLRERQHKVDAHRTQQHKATAEHNKSRLSAIQRDVEAAEAAHAAGHLADLTRLIGAIDHALKAGAVTAELAQRIESLRREHARLRDWQRWSGGKRREELVAEAQALAQAAAGKVAIKAQADAIDNLRQRWKELDKLGAATNQTLWLAFDGALKTAYTPVAEHLEKLKAARKENLAARNQIIEGLKEAAAKYLPVAQEAADGAPDAKPDWRAVARSVEEAQIAWRKLGPVEHTVPRSALQGDNAVTARYAHAAEALETPLREAYGEATRQREQLIAAARNLGAPEGPTRDLIDKVRTLQTQWQAAAKALPLPRREENALWNAFKAATDGVFTALDAARAAKKAEFDARNKAREEVIQRLATLASATNAAEIKRTLAEAETAWRACPEAPRPQAAKLESRYRAVRDAGRRRLGELAAHASQARFDALIAAMAICEERESAGEQSPDLEARWTAIENLPDAWKAKLEARFLGVAALEPATQSGSKAAAKSPATLPDILLNLEIACGIDSPAEFLAARQQLKLLALKNAMEIRQNLGPTPADVERWLLEAAATARPDATSRERLAKIIPAVRQRQRS